MPQKYTMRSKEEKLAIVKRNLSGEAARVLAIKMADRRRGRKSSSSSTRC